MSRSYASGKLFKHQNTLPALPVPTLEETCEKYLTTIRPLVNDQDFERNVKLVQDLKKPGGFGQVLQNRLLERASKSKTSWLFDWWNDYAYFGYRDPVVINVNYFFAFVADPFRKDPALRAASIVTGATVFRDLIVSEQLEPDVTKNGPLCSDQYRYLFNSTRIPEIPSDITRASDPVKDNFIVVMRKNQFFKLDLTYNGQKLSTAELTRQFKRIYQIADKVEAPFGLFTTENRDVWTKLRKDVLKVSKTNQETLDYIERAAFIVCLDDTKPVTKEEISRACWHGDGRNRFFDKSIQFIVFDNGQAGFNGEHSMMEATPTSRLCEFICEGLTKGKFDHGTSNLSNLPAPKKLVVDLTPELKTALEKAGEKFDAVVAKHDLKVVCFEGYGKNLIKKLGVSPDAYAQLAIQLAYYKMYGVSRPTYESAQTKKYAYGRTETCRSVSSESVAWVKAMQDPTLPLKTKGELGRKAIKSHTAYILAACDGHGVDRHFLGLKLLVAPGEEKPALFSDPVFNYSCHWYLSSSNISSEYYQGYGWGEVVPDGYGIAYMVNNDRLHFNLVSLHLKNDHLREYFHEALNEMKLAFEASIPPAKAKL